jgi:hypothetical protein
MSNSLRSMMSVVYFVLEELTCIYGKAREIREIAKNAYVKYM